METVIRVGIRISVLAERIWQYVEHDILVLMIFVQNIQNLQNWQYLQFMLFIKYGSSPANRK